MSEFDEQILALIESKESVFLEIERVLFTGRYKLSRNHVEIFAVQSITMIYAIWEGFIQQSFQMYIGEINAKKSNLLDLGEEIIIFHMENSFKQFLEYPEKSKKKVDFYLGLNSLFSSSQHKIHSTINTQSNVSFDVLNSMLKSFCLEQFPERWEKYNYPNPTLKETLRMFLRYRNGIAHGGDISSEEKVTHDVFYKYKTLVLDLMYGIRERMIFGLDNLTYLKSR